MDDMFKSIDSVSTPATFTQTVQKIVPSLRHHPNVMKSKMQFASSDYSVDNCLTKWVLRWCHFVRNCASLVDVSSLCSTVAVLSLPEAMASRGLEIKSVLDQPFTRTKKLTSFFNEPGNNNLGLLNQ